MKMLPLIQNMQQGVVQFHTSTAKRVINPNKIEVFQVPINVLAKYQKQMSRAPWKPCPARKLGFLVTHEDVLLGIIALTSPVIRLTARDNFLFPCAPFSFDYGRALRSYMDLSVCVAAQPIGWHWNIGKLLAMIAPTLKTEVESVYPSDEFKGVITTGFWGKSSQYNRIYKFLGYTEGHGHEHISEADYRDMVRVLKACHTLPSCKWDAGSNPKMRRIAAYKKLTGDRFTTLFHGHRRGVYYSSTVSVPPIQTWYERWGLPRYERTKNIRAPYQNGTENIAA
jgi:hypothetical protein